jgi:SpoVK/Ycf46/Vps4 family AAA+-type ATPase
MSSRYPNVSSLGPGENPFADAATCYAHDLLAATDVRRLEVGVVERLLRCDLISESELLALDPGDAADDDDPFADPPPRRRLYGGPPRERLEARIEAWRRGARAEVPARAPVGGFVGANLALFAALLGFDAADRALFEFVTAVRCSAALKDLTEAFGSVSLGAAAALVAAATGVRSADAARALRSGRAVKSGVLEVGGSEMRDFGDRLDLKDGVLDLVLTPGLDRAMIVSRFLPAAPPSALGWGDFSAVREGAELARDLLAAALRTRRPGVNVLLYGATGTGKTELARLLAAQVGAALHVAGAADDDGDPPEAAQRLSSLVLGHRLLERSGAVLLFDELEDLFTWEGGHGDPFARRGGASGRMSKAWFNQLLESNPVPTVWISNNVEGVDPAFLRRFAFAVAFRAPGPGQRARMLARHLAPTDALSPADVEAVATRFAVPAATLHGAVSAARLIASDGCADRAGVERVLAPLDRLLNGGGAGRALDFDAGAYDLAALNSPVDLVGLADRLAAWQPGARAGVTLCLHGPPGTGKSEYVKYLAHRMGRRVIHRRVSDLQSKWVGETEKAIAEAFLEAEEEGAVLLFDEADSFLRDRRGASRGWEVTQVNEFLQRLECARGVVACTTNLAHDLDEAALRRFVFKIPFGFLDGERAAALFARALAPHLAAPLGDDEREVLVATLARVGDLAPGDFAAVARRLGALGARVTVASCVAELQLEVRAKQRAPRAPVGFALGGPSRA